MKKAEGLRRYFYEYVFHQAVDQAREQAAEVIPISQARAVRARVDELLDQLSAIAAVEGGEARRQSLAHPALSISSCLSAIDQALGESVRDYEPQFGDHSASGPAYQRLQRGFSMATGVGGEKVSPKSARLPISPYDLEWAERSTIKRGGTSLSYLPDETIQRVAGGSTGKVADPTLGNITLWRLDGEGKPFEAGRAMTYDDASGLTALMDKMSQSEYEQVRGWVIDGGRDPRTGKIDMNRFMSRHALSRSVAVLDELKDQGVPYEISRDLNPGQIKAKLSDTGMEIRLTETRQSEDYAGARIYDTGMVMRYSTNQRVPGGMATYSASPQDAVDLLRFAQGKPVERRDRPGVTAGTTGMTHPEVGRSGHIEVPDSYFNDKESMFVVGDFGLGSKVLLRRENESRTLPRYSVDATDAENYGRAAVDSARENFTAALDVDGLLAHHVTQRQDEEDPSQWHAPEFSADAEIASIQRSYWDVLTGERSALLRPGATEEMYTERLEAIGESAEVDMGNLVYGGSSEEVIRSHAEDVPFELLGTWDAEPHEIDGQWTDQRFDPGRVARWMTSPTGQWSNLDNLAVALRRAEIPPEEVMGSGFQTTRFKDRLVRFDPETAVDVSKHDSAFIRNIGEVVRQTLQRGGTIPDHSIQIDEQGVISWSAQKVGRNGRGVPVSGQIGQVFDVGEHGEIVTSFASGQNALIVPGYQARIAAQPAGERPTSVEERTLLRGYEQMVTERIQHQIAGDLVSTRSEVGEPASINGVYSQLYGTKHPVDFIERATRHEIDRNTGVITSQLDDWTATILETEAKRVRYSNEIKAGSTIYAEYRSERDKSDPANDNRFDAWQLTGGRNMTVLTGKDAHGNRAPAGYFDPVMTGGAVNQGIVRYLTEDAEVSPDGVITPGDGESPAGTRASLMNRPELATLAYDPFDRQQMTASTIMQSSKVSEPAGTAMMTFGGWTADDPIVVSKEFAEANMIRGAGGTERALVIGDKLSDFHGNKGVVSLVVDRDMSLDEARERGLEREVAWFKQNPDMDVVMSPFSMISRRNAGSARELMSGSTSDLRSPDPSSQERLLVAISGGGAEALDQSTVAGVGQMQFVVTHMAVDEKTKIYDDEQLAQGRGRKASSQLAWALQSQDCPSVMAEFYGHNTGPESNLREYLQVVGMDMEADGTLRAVGTSEELDETPQRRFIAMPELTRTAPTKGSTVPGLNTAAMRRSFGDLIGDRGGDMEIPFPLTYPTGEQTEQVTASSWKLPVMSSHLRSGQEFEDGTSITHDYTRSYQEVFVQSCRYRLGQEKLSEPRLPEAKRTKILGEMSTSMQKAQRAYEAISSDVQNRVLTGKNNVFKTGLMASRLSDSATMVWTADPRLDIDQVALSTDKAEQLGLAEGDHALIWRDPVLRDAGVRYMRVAINDELTGAAINPVMDACFDGDFDGDAVAVVRLHTQAAKDEAIAKLSVPANLLDTGVAGPDGSHPLAMQLSLDTQVAISKNLELAEEFDSLKAEANLLNRAERGGESSESVMARQTDVTEQLSDLYRTAQRSEFGTALRFDDAGAHVRSVVEACVETGAKGSMAKAEDYMRYLGVELDGNTGNLRQALEEDTPLVDTGRPGISKEDHEASMFATAIKAHGTGLGGSYSQRAVRALRSEDLKAVLELTYPVTQSILQAKHSATEARHKYEMLQGPGRELWRGRKIEHTGPGQWSTEFNDGEAVQATREEWVDQFRDFYSAPDGFNVKVNPEYVDRVARALEDPATGRVRNLEEEPSLAGTVMDRMAYGGDFEGLVAAAKKRENVYDGVGNEQFAPLATSKARAVSEAELVALEQGQRDVELSERMVDASVLKRDVLAEDVDKARTRRAGRRSQEAVAVGPRASWTPTFEPEATNGGHDEGMEL